MRRFFAVRASRAPKKRVRSRTYATTSTILVLSIFLGSCGESVSLVVDVPETPESRWENGDPGADLVQTPEVTETPVVGTVLAEPVVVRVKDKKGRSFVDLPVTWTISDPTGGVGESAGGGFSSTLSTRLNAQGESSVLWRVGTVSGSQSITASVAGPGNGKSKRVTSTLDAMVVAGPPAELIVSPTQVRVMVDDQQDLDATVMDEFGNDVEDVAVDWTSTLRAIATVDTGGTVTGENMGITVVSASVGSLMEDAIIEVVSNSPALGSLAITPGSVSRSAGQTAQLSVTAVDSLGNPITPLVAWESRDPSVATVNGTGRVTTTGDGTTFVVATSGCCDADSIPVTVDSTSPALGTLLITPRSASREVGETAQLSVTAVDSLGNPITPPVGWASRDPSVATVDGAGLLTAIGDGTTFVAVTSGCCDADSIPVTVTVTGGAPALGLLLISPASVASTVGETVQLSVAAVDSLGNPITPPIGWTIGDPSVATIDDAGLVTAISDGSTFVTASSDCCESHSAPVTIASGPPALGSLVISPDSVSRMVGETAQLSVSAFDSSGNPITPLVGWESRDPSLVTVNGTGVVTAIGTGTTFVVATGGCCDPDSVPVTVESGPPALGSLAITPGSLSRTVGQTAQLSVTAVDSLGNPITPVVQWESRDPSVATINGTGLVTAIGEGTTFVAVTGNCCDADSIPVTVENGTPALGSLVITPGSLSRTVGQTAQLSVTAVDSLGNPISPLVSWESTKTFVAAVSGTGFVTATGSGTATITATNACCEPASIQVTVQDGGSVGSIYDPYLQAAWTDTVHYEDFTAIAAPARFDVEWDQTGSGPAPFTGALLSWVNQCTGGAGSSGYGGANCDAQDSVVFANQASPPWVWENFLEANSGGALEFEVNFEDGNGPGASANLTRVYIRYSIFFEEDGVGIGREDYAWQKSSNKYFNMNQIGSGFFQLWYDQGGYFWGQSSPDTDMGCEVGLTPNSWVDYYPADTLAAQTPECTAIGRGGHGKTGVWQHHFVCFDFSRPAGSRVISWGMTSTEEQGIAGYHDNLTNYNAGPGLFTDFDSFIWNGTWGGTPKTHNAMSYWFDDLLIMTGSSGSCVTPPSFS